MASTNLLPQQAFRSTRERAIAAATWDINTNIGCATHSSLEGMYKRV